MAGSTALLTSTPRTHSLSRSRAILRPVHANSVGVSKAWDKSKQDPEVHDVVRYLLDWVAGTRLIFLALLVVILLTADAEGLFYTSLGRMLSLRPRRSRCHSQRVTVRSLALGGDPSLRAPIRASCSWP